MPAPSNPILPATWEVPQLFRDRLGKMVGRQRMMTTDGHLLLVLHAPPERDHDQRQARLFWRKPDGSWSSNANGSGIGSLIKLLDEYDARLDKLEEKEQIADTAKDYFEINERLAPLLRSVTNLHTVLQDARKQCQEVRELIDARDRSYQIERNAELLATGCKNGLDYQMARQAEEQAKSGHKMAVASHRLNQLAAFFLPLATLSGLFGVNLQHGLEKARAPYAFLTVTFIALFIGALFAYSLGPNEKSSSSN